MRASVPPVETKHGMEVPSVNCPAFKVWGHDSNGNVYFRGFPNNTIPSKLIDATNSAPLIANIPLPNDGQAFVGTFPAPISWHEELIKIDDQVNPKLRANFRL